MDRTNANPRYNLATLLLVTTLIAVFLALFRVSQGFGVLSLLLGIPALLRTMSLVEREGQYGRRLSPGEKVCVYLGSLLVTLLVLIAGAAAGFAASFLVTRLLLFSFGPPSVMFVEPFVAGFAAIVAAGWTIRCTWPSRATFLARLRVISTGSLPETENPGNPSA